jgi:hypothetical protein
VESGGDAQGTVLGSGGVGAVGAGTLCFTGYAFQKLPHPLQPLLSTLPVVSGLEIDK